MTIFFFFRFPLETHSYVYKCFFLLSSGNEPLCVGQVQMLVNKWAERVRSSISRAIRWLARQQCTRWADKHLPRVFSLSQGENNIFDHILFSFFDYFSRKFWPWYTRATPDTLHRDMRVCCVNTNDKWPLNGQGNVTSSLPNGNFHCSARQVDDFSHLFLSERSVAPQFRH